MKEPENQNQSEAEQDSIEETQQRLEIDWQRIASFSKTVVSHSNKAKMMFEVQSQLEAVKSLKRIQELKGNSALQALRRCEVNQTYRSKSAKQSCI